MRTTNGKKMKNYWMFAKKSKTKKGIWSRGASAGGGPLTGGMASKTEKTLPRAPQSLFL